MNYLFTKLICFSILYNTGVCLECYKCKDIETKYSNDLFDGVPFDAHTNAQCSHPDQYGVDTETCPDSSYVCGAIHGSVEGEYGLLVKNSFSVEVEIRGCVQESGTGCTDASNDVAGNVALSVVEKALSFVSGLSNVDISGRLCTCSTDYCVAGMCSTGWWIGGVFCVEWYMLVGGGCGLFLLILLCCLPCCCRSRNRQPGHIPVPGQQVVVVSQNTGQTNPLYGVTTSTGQTEHVYSVPTPAGHVNPVYGVSTATPSYQVLNK